MSGWIAIKRGITSHPIFHKRPDRAFVWLWMLETAAYKDTRQDAGGRPVEVKRGQVLTSFRQMAAATGVGVQVIRTLLAQLEAECAINTSTNNGRMLVTICNYDKYQSAAAQANSVSNTELTQSQHTKETRKQDLPVSNETGAAVSIDPEKAMFDSGIELLARAGVRDRQARSLLGKWRKEHGSEAVIVALGRAQREGAISPVEFIQGHLRKARTGQGARASPGEQRILADGRVLELVGGEWVEVRQ